MPNFNIYHLTREYAYEHGDPLLGTVKAHTSKQAETIALNRGLGVPGIGVLAVRCSDSAMEFPICHRAHCRSYGAKKSL
jgi:hypothetical protein